MVRGMFLVVVLVVTGCASGAEPPPPVTAPSTTAYVELPTPPPYRPAKPARLSPRAVAALALRHLDRPDAAYDPRLATTAAVLYYRPEPGHRSFTVSAGYGRSPGMFSCPGDDSEAPRVSCEVSGRLRLVWREGDAGSAMVGFLAPRARGSVLVQLAGMAVTGRPRSADLPLPLRQLRSLARDRRFDQHTDRGLGRPRHTQDVWRADPDCRRARPRPPLTIGPGSEAPGPATPQGLAALVATRVTGTGAGEALSSRGTGATLFLDGSDGESVTAVVTADADAGACPDGAECEERDGALVTWVLDVPEEYALRVRGDPRDRRRLRRPHRAQSPGRRGHANLPGASGDAAGAQRGPAVRAPALRCRHQRRDDAAALLARHPAHRRRLTSVLAGLRQPTGSGVAARSSSRVTAER